MKKLILILSLVFVFTSCSKQNEKQAEKETEPVKPAPSLERKSVLQEYLEETADKYPIQRKPVFGEDPVPQPSFCFDDLIEYGDNAVGGMFVPTFIDNTYDYKTDNEDILQSLVYGYGLICKRLDKNEFLKIKGNE